MDYSQDHSQVWNFYDTAQIPATSVGKKWPVSLKSGQLKSCFWIDIADNDWTFSVTQERAGKKHSKHIYKPQATSNPRHNLRSFLREKIL
jgi:hypothetical protein